MTVASAMNSVQDRFNHLLHVIASERFLKQQGLGNEVPFFICPFAPQDAIEMARIVKQLVRRLNQQGIRVLHVDLYDLSVELMQARGVWERVLELEPTVNKDQFKELLQGVLDPAAHLIPAIAEKMQQNEFDVMFITGVGEVFPYIRSHTVLNNLQSTAKDQPTILFFPGDYTHSLATGASLDLFGRLHDDKYYRAFNIFQVRV